MVDLEAVSKCVSSQVIAFINSDRSRYLCLSAAAALLKYIEFIQVSSLVSEPCTARLPTHPPEHHLRAEQHAGTTGFVSLHFTPILQISFKGSEGTMLIDRNAVRSLVPAADCGAWRCF